MQEGIVSAGEKQFPVNGRVTIGRTPDNIISFSGDEKISRNHAYIEQRGDEFYIVDLGSSNGSKLNGIPFTGEHHLNSGDYAIFGNSSVVVFSIIEEDHPAEGDEPSGEAEAAAAPEATPEEKKKNRVMLAGAGGALVLAMAIGGGAMYMASGSSCAATAKIISPEPGDTITKETEIEVESDNAGCVAKAIFTIDGAEFATANTEPFEATIDPKDHPDLADGFDHVLGIVLVDKYGERIYEPPPIALAFETRKVVGPANTTVAQNNSNTVPTAAGKKVSLVEIQQLSAALAKNISPNFSYNLSNKQFLEEVQKRAAEYAQDGNFDRAFQYRDAINVAFVRENDIPAAFGYYLALSRSKFSPAKQGADEGIFRMTTEFVESNKYNGPCGAETLSDPKQECAAKAAGMYMKSVYIGLFERDAVYAAAAFGRSPADAGAWKASLPATRNDFWNIVKTPEERERIVRFFAAGIVSENPQKFGLKDRPFAELYKLAT
ncbi:MAG: FHA domain-containing protein [bacterium]|nr:FHA domain-containing protein [bacterium]